MTTSNPVNAFDLPNHTQQSITRNSTKKALVVIDSKIENYQSLMAGVSSNSDVIIIYPEDDAIAKISQQIADDPEISSIHLVSHGSPGCLYLGNGELSLNTLHAKTPALSKWKARESLDILIYGCNVGAGGAGKEFVHKLREITQANIAVSANKTGNKELGGDWNLEIRLGNIEPTLVFNQEARESYTGIFAEAVLAASIYPGEFDSSPRNLTVFNNELYFSATLGDVTKLFKYNPTEGASLVADISPASQLGTILGSSPSNLTVFNGELYFTADVGVHGEELWKYNPADGASLAADIQPINTIDVNRSSNPRNLTVFNDELYFSAEVFGLGKELWKYNPNDGASLVADIRPGGDYSSPSNLTVFNDELYFNASDGDGVKLWKYNSTDGVSPFSFSDSINTARLDEIAVFNNELYFRANDGIHGEELWKYNPTDGASLVADIHPSNEFGYDPGSSPSNLTVFDGIYTLVLMMELMGENYLSFREMTLLLQ